MARPLSPLDRIVALPRWTPADARVVLDALAASGLSVAAFAQQHGVQAQRLFAWRRQLAAVDTAAPVAPPPPVTFVEVPPRAAAAPPPCRYELALTSGDVLRVEGAVVDVATVGALLAVLRAPRTPPC